MLIEVLRKMLGPGGVVTDSHELGPFTEDWRGRYRGSALCVALPSSIAQVAAVVEMCAQAGVPVLAQGGNTSLCGGAVPDAAGPQPVIVNLQRMRQIRSIDPANNAICVDAGCVLAAVQQAAIENDRLYPVSLGAEGSCQIGGAIATNAGGTGVLRYGNMRENVLGLEVVLADGSVWNGLYALRKNNTGYDLKHLFVGSEGTLGIITGAVLKLHSLPTARSMAWLGVPSPDAALDVLGMFRASHEARLTAFELLDAHQVRLVLEHIPGRRCPLTGSFGWHVLVELSDTSDTSLLDEAMHAVLEQALAQGLVSDAVVATSEAQRLAMWEFRHSVSEANKKGGVGLTTDCAVPTSAVPRFIARATETVHAIVPHLPIVVVAHLGDGNVHFIPFFSFAQWEVISDKDDFAQQIRAAVNDTAVALGGTFSAEHGIGRTLTGEMARYKPPAEIAMMQAIKRALDPNNLLNPGRLLPSAASAKNPS
jgi:FAD/FMN-containing dehydrogenase